MARVIDVDFTPEPYSHVLRPPVAAEPRPKSQILNRQILDPKTLNEEPYPKLGPL